MIVSGEWSIVLWSFDVKFRLSTRRNRQAKERYDMKERKETQEM